MHLRTHYSLDLSLLGAEARHLTPFLCTNGGLGTNKRFSSLRCFIPVSTKSRIIDSTSLPTYPTSVNLVASTLMKGALANFASLRAIQFYLPLLVLSSVYFEMNFFLSSSFNCILRHLLRTVLLIFCLILTNNVLFNSCTISLGVIVDICCLYLDFNGFYSVILVSINTYISCYGEHLETISFGDIWVCLARSGSLA